MQPAQWLKWLERMVQWPLDALHHFRKWFVTTCAFLSIRLFAIELTWNEVYRGSYSSRKHSNLNLDNIQVPEEMLTIAQASLAQEETRRTTVADKCKTLLTLTSLLVGLVGILLPRTIVWDTGWAKLGFFVAIAALINTITLLLVIFDVGADSVVSLDPSDISLPVDDLRKSFINRNRECRVAIGNRTDFQVDVYKTARFFFLFGLTIVATLFSVNFLTKSAEDQTAKLMRELRSDAKLISLLRGPTGDKGDRGDPGKDADLARVVSEIRSNPKVLDLLRGPSGEKGEPGKDAIIDEKRIVDRVLTDPRLKQQPAPVP